METAFAVTVTELSDRFSPSGVLRLKGGGLPLRPQDANNVSRERPGV
jgi:hypothetical protein